MTTAPALSPDAAMVLGLAGTALPFARTPDEEAERWLRVMRLQGDVGGVLQAVGVGEARLEEPDRPENRGGRPQPEGDRDVVTLVTEHATRLAAGRGAGSVTTTDVLRAVMHVYGEDFDRALQAHGADRDEVLERIDHPAAGPRQD
jgi:hypothetical protein